MKKLLIVSILLWSSLNAFPQSWVGITGNTPEKAKAKLVSSDIDNTVIKFSVTGYNSKPLNTGQQTTMTITVEGSTYILDAGAPDLPKLSASVIIPDKGAIQLSLSPMDRHIRKMRFIPANLPKCATRIFSEIIAVKQSGFILFSITR